MSKIKGGAEDEGRTRDLRLGKATHYHCATSAYVSYYIAVLFSCQQIYGQVILPTEPVDKLVFCLYNTKQSRLAEVGVFYD